MYELRARRIPTRNNHGTGCTFASAIAAALALGSPLPDALTAAKSYVTRAITDAADWQLGAGHGPIAHFPPTS